MESGVNKQTCTGLDFGELVVPQRMSRAGGAENMFPAWSLGLGRATCLSGLAQTGESTVPPERLQKTGLATSSVVTAGGGSKPHSESQWPRLKRPVSRTAAQMLRAAPRSESRWTNVY